MLHNQLLFHFGLAAQSYEIRVLAAAYGLQKRCSSLAGERYQLKSSLLFSLDGEFRANLRCVLAVGNSFPQATITACDLNRGCNRGGGYNARCNTVQAHS